MPVQMPNYNSPYTTGVYGNAGPGAVGRSASSGPASTFSANNTSGSDDKNTPDGKNTDNNKKTGSNTTDPSPTDGTSGSNSVIDAVFGDEDDKQVSMDDFLTLMVAQLKNQDFMNPVDDTQYVTQLAQISTMQQMEEMAYNAKSTYVASLVGKYATAAKFTVSGDLKKSEGIVDKISLLDGKFVIYVDGEAYKMDEIMEIKTEPATTTPPDDDDDKDTPPDDDKNPGDNKSGKV